MSQDEKTIDPSRSVASLCVEYWKLARGAERVISALPEKEAKRFKSQINYSERQLDILSNEIGCRLIDLAGEPFHAGLSASADNSEDFDDEEALVVIETIEPPVVMNMKTVRPGRVLVAPKKV